MYFLYSVCAGYKGYAYSFSQLRYVYCFIVRKHLLFVNDLAKNIANLELPAVCSSYHKAICCRIWINFYVPVRRHILRFQAAHSHGIACRIVAAGAIIYHANRIGTGSAVSMRGVDRRTGAAVSTKMP